MTSLQGDVALKLCRPRFGPLADIGVAGSFESETSPDPNPDPETSETEITYTSFGFSAGLALVF